MSVPFRIWSYRAYHKGTTASKKKKISRLKRAKNQIKKHARKERGSETESFAALQLLNDPHRFAEKLFARVRTGRERFETRLSMITAISRAIGIHKLVILNFYPYLQKYMRPSQQDATCILAALVHSSHELVPPDALAPVMRQLADNFVHDRARPEVVTVGLKTIREICVRAPLVMTKELLSDLEMYRKVRDKQISAAAKGVICLFREIAPSMLHRKNRGRVSNLDAMPAAYGSVLAKDRIEGADLLEDASVSSVESDDLGDDENDFGVGALEADETICYEGGEDKSDEEQGGEEEEEVWISNGDGVGTDSCDDDDSLSNVMNSDEGLELMPSNAALAQPKSDVKNTEPVAASMHAEAVCNNDDGASTSGTDSLSSSGCDEVLVSKSQKRKREADPNSIASLQKKIAIIKKNAAATHEKGNDFEQQDDQEQTNVCANETAAPGIPIEMRKVLDESDFERLQELRHKQLVKRIMAKHGLVSVHRKGKLLEAAEEAASESLRLERMLHSITEERIEPEQLMGKRRGKPGKEEVQKAAMKGREDREGFQASSKLKKRKTGGLSNKEKEKRKNLPVVARVSQAKKRRRRNAIKRKGKNFKGHVR